MVDFTKLTQYIREQIIGSNLADSTICGTGFEVIPVDNISQETGYLQGIPILVQVVGFTEVIRPNKPCAFVFKLSDGTNIVTAFAHASLLGNNLDFNSLALGYKVSLAFKKYDSLTVTNISNTITMIR